ncbi:ATP-binding protein [Streptomyces sp. GMY01]|uniref:ATP-binding protein n=1 Tax=Streptomyces sp. GMY02 TaxID=1333528 RepID=UPI00146BB6D0|nr:ATP-binding protein [Streptomyces sp. GMY02]NMO33241.1 ATP-binding protein [Streptomyces sp. GMY02]
MPNANCSLFGTPPEDGHAPWPTYEPLAPWHITGHEDLWVDIDHLPNALLTFRTEVGAMARGIRPGEDGHGHLVVVSGLPGTGKSSLLHRCVHELVQLLDGFAQPAGDDPEQPEDAAGPVRQERPWSRRRPARTAHVVRIDGNANEGRGLGSPPGAKPFVPQYDMTVHRIARLIVEKLCADEEFAAAWHREDRPEQPDPYLAWRRLTTTLEACGRALVVIVPHIDWQDADIARRFLRFCYDRSTRGVVFFVETKRTDAGRDIDTFFTEKERKGITHLQTSALRPQDWGKYLRHWMEVRDIPAPKIVIHDDVLDYQPETWALLSISRLQDCLRQVSQEAVLNDEGQLRKSHVADWFEAHRPKPEAFLREPGATRHGQETR